MRIRKSIVLIITALLACSPGYGQDISEKIDQLINSYYQNGIFNGAVLVSQKGNVVYKKAFGIADRDWNIPHTTDTKFKIASLSKAFTALAIMQMVSVGEISLNGKIKDYIPDYAGQLGDSITIHELLNHSSGIRSNLDPEEELIKQRLHHDLREMVNYAETSKLLFKPGSRFEYSNFGYNILAYIIQSVSGKHYADVLKEKIFDPAGMKSTGQYDNSLVESRLAKGYEYKLIYGYRNADFVDASLTTGPGGIISTVEDLYLFDRALYSDKLIPHESLTGIFKPYQPGNYGYGWFISKRMVNGVSDSLVIADHSGSIDGFGSYMARILNDSSFVVVLKNQRADTYIDPGFAPDMGRQIISILYGENVILPKISVARHIASLIGNCGIDIAINEYYRIVKEKPDNYNLGESELNKLGIELYFRFSMPNEALKIFEVNMLQFPRSYNTYDSYAFILMKKGDYASSIKYYRLGLEVLKTYPLENNNDMVRKDAENALAYIKDMEGKLKM
jgi:CubicO group peptidase (beta-lactamase class C family)